MQCQLEPEDLKIHYNSYLAAGHISIYKYTILYQSCLPLRNPLSGIFGSQQVCKQLFFLFFNQLSNAIGEYPLLCRNIPGDVSALNITEMLLSDVDVPLELDESVTFSTCADS